MTYVVYKSKKVAANTVEFTALKKFTQLKNAKQYRDDFEVSEDGTEKVFVWDTTFVESPMAMIMNYAI